MEFRVSRFYQFKPQSRRRLRPKLGTEVHPCGAFHRRRRLRRSNMTFFARSRSLRVLRPRRRFGTGEGNDGRRTLGGSWRGTRFRVRVLARSSAKGRVKIEPRMAISMQIEKIPNVKLLYCPRKVGEPLFLFWREGGALTDNDVD